MTPRLPALALSAAAVLSFVTGASAASSQDVGPEVVAWWSAADANAATSAVTAPDAGPKDLYVSGANAVAAPVVALGPTGPVAIGGLRFRLPPGATVKELTLRLGGVHPPAVSVTACRALRPFTQVYGGAWADVPPYDCSDAGTTRLTADGRIVVDGLDQLRRGRELDLVLVPGPLDRVVVAAPDAHTLQVTAPSQPSVDPAPPPATPPAYAPVGSVPPESLTTLGGALLSPSGPGRAAQPAAPLPAPPPPALAASITAATPGRPWPVLLTTLLLAAAAFAWSVRPSSSGGPGQARERGVGRLRSERSGSVPDLT